MVEGAIDCVRRGFHSFVAIWPLLLVRLVETIVMLVVMVGGFFLAMIPIGIHVGLSDLDSWADDPEAMAEWLLGNAGTIFYLLLAVSILVGIAVLIHSYFEAGVASLYLDHIRSGATFPANEAWRRFSLDAFTTAALSRGWSVFLVFNIVWGVAGAVLLIPLGLILAIALLFRDSPAAIVFTCFGVFVSVVLGVVVSIIAAVWAQIALTITAGERRGAIESSGRAGDLMRARLGVTILTVIIVYAVILGISSVTSTFNIGLSALAEVPGAAMAAIGMQIIMFFFNSVVSTILGLWTAAVWAAFVASSGAPPIAPSGGNVGPRNPVVG